MKLHEIQVKTIKTKSHIAKEVTLTNPEPTHQEELLKYNDNQTDKCIDQIVKTLKKDCSEVLKIYKSANSDNDKTPANLMYRGERSDVVFFKNSIWAKRRPKYLDQFTHDVSVTAFTDLGLIANRENSIFCARYDIAKNWGSSVYVIFPVNGYEVTWFDSKKVGEYLYNHLEYSRNEFVNNIAHKKYPDYKWDFEGDSDEEYNKNKELEKKFEDYKSKLWKDLENKNPPLLKEYEQYVVSLIKKFKPVTNDLERALKTIYNKEYLVTGKAYYGVQLAWLLENRSIFKSLF